MAKLWQPLQENDMVRIIAPSSKVANAWEHLQIACDYLTGLKLNPVFSKNIFSTKKNAAPNFSQFANTDEKRYEDFIDAIDSDAKAIWCFRGGYGSDRVLNQIVKNNFKPSGSNKLFIGFSDITNLHSYMNSAWQWSTLHSASIRQLSLNQVEPDDVEITQQIIFGQRKAIQLNLIPLNAHAKQSGEIHGEISGGNVTVIQSAIATAWQTPVKNKIILLEDVDEAPYRVARMLQHFLASHLFHDAKAILFGDFTQRKSPNSTTPHDTRPMDNALQEFADACDLPVLRYHGIGHGRKNYPIPFATPTKLVLGEQPELTAATGAAF